MARRYSIAAGLSLAMALALAAPAFAGNWAEVTIDSAAPSPGDDGTTVVEFTLLQHGVTPVEWGQVTVAATDPNGQTVSGTASPVGGGHWTVSLALAGGDWVLDIRHSQLQVSPAGSLTVAGPSESAATGASTSVTWMVGAVLLVALLLLLGSLSLFVLRRRSRGTAASLEMGTPATRRA